MSIYVGSRAIKEIYVGTRKIKKAYVGDELVYDGQDGGILLPELPAGYTAVEYLDCPKGNTKFSRYISGFQLTLSANCSVEIKFSLDKDADYSTGNGYYGSFVYYSYDNKSTTTSGTKLQQNLIYITSSGSTMVYWGATTGVTSYNSYSAVVSTSTSGLDIKDGNIYTITVDYAGSSGCNGGKYTAKANGIYKTSWNVSKPSVMLLGGNPTTNAYQRTFVGHIYHMKMFSNEELVNHLVPAYDSGGVYGLYNIIKSKFYSSATDYPFSGPK